MPTCAQCQGSASACTHAPSSLTAPSETRRSSSPANPRQRARVGSNSPRSLPPIRFEIGREDLLLSPPQPKAGADGWSLEPLHDPRGSAAHHPANSPMPPSLPAMLPTCLALTCLAQSSANSSHGPMAGRDGDVSSVLRPVPGCDVRCRRSPVARPVLAGSQAEQGRCSRCARLCLQLRFAFRETLHPRQPLACQPAVSPPGPAPRGCRALGPKAPSFWGANAAERGCALSRGGGAQPLLDPREGGGT